MGNRKHARSGQGGPSPKQKVSVARAANEEIRRQQEVRRKKKDAEPKFSSVAELIKSRDNKEL
ncbi:hypothetical protein K8R03_02190 [Candidatus Kaiserbacteria bacterium]|nr:hypothetical protein [Candidatus Kaiserbacteria bacterium]